MVGNALDVLFGYQKDDDGKVGEKLKYIEKQ